jgi:hypothetical protein
MKKGSFVNTQPLLHLWRAAPSRDPATDSHCVRLDPCACVHLCPAATDPCSFYSSHHGQPTFVAVVISSRRRTGFVEGRRRKAYRRKCGNTIQVTLQKVAFRVEGSFEGIEHQYVGVTHPKYCVQTTCVSRLPRKRARRAELNCFQNSLGWKESTVECAARIIALVSFLLRGLSCRRQNLLGSRLRRTWLQTRVGSEHS